MRALLRTLWAMRPPDSLYTSIPIQHGDLAASKGEDILQSGVLSQVYQGQIQHGDKAEQLDIDGVDELRPQLGDESGAHPHHGQKGAP